MGCCPAKALLMAMPDSDPKQRDFEAIRFTAWKEALEKEAVPNRQRDLFREAIFRFFAPLQNRARAGVRQRSRSRRTAVVFPGEPRSCNSIRKRQQDSATVHRRRERVINQSRPTA